MKGFTIRSEDLGVYDDPDLRQLTKEIVKADEQRQALIDELNGPNPPSAFTTRRNEDLLAPLEVLDTQRAALQARWATTLEAARSRVAPHYAATSQALITGVLPILREFVEKLQTLGALEDRIRADFSSADAGGKPFGTYLPPGTPYCNTAGLARAVGDVELFLRLLDQQTKEAA